MEIHVERTCIYYVIDVYSVLINNLKCLEEDNNLFVYLKRTGPLAGSPEG